MIGLELATIFFIVVVFSFTYICWPTPEKYNSLPKAYDYEAPRF